MQNTLRGAWMVHNSFFRKYGPQHRIESHLRRKILNVEEYGSILQESLHQHSNDTQL